jgi:REP element-mobilizing transposase RayT
MVNSHQHLMPQSYAALYCHIIFSTKNREPFIKPEWQPRLYFYMGGILKEEKCVLLAAGGIADHVHLLVSLSREVAVAPLLRVLKSNSSNWVHETFPDLSAFAWQTGYGAFSVSHSNRDQVKHYLARQEEHHRKQPFQEEFLAFLHLHDIPYDERYIWD